jgi:hypothetical protein
MDFRGEMNSDEDDYLLARAEAELELAQRSSHPGAVRAHYLLAGYYLDRVYRPEPTTDPSEPTPQGS